MADTPNLPYMPNAEEVQQAIEYSTLDLIHPIDGIVANKGTIALNLEFEDYDTHVDMCYEFSDCQLLEPISDSDEMSGILICYELEENAD